MSAEEEKKEYTADDGAFDSTELDEYGVWVKSGPDDLDSDLSADSVENLDLEDVGSDVESGSLDAWAESEQGNPESESLEDDLMSLDDADFSLDESFGDNEPDELDSESDTAFDELNEDLSFSIDEDDIADDTRVDDQAGESELTAEEEALLSELEEDDNEEPAAIDEEPAAIDTESSFELDDFDDIEAVTRDLTDEPPEEAEKPQAAARDVSPQVLEKIEGELSGIRTEIAALKAELAELYGLRDTVKTSGPETETPDAPSTVESVSSPVEEFESDDLFVPDEDETDATTISDVLAETDDEFFLPQDDEEGGGFFDDDGDETIALTGDELDNILSTAEFTEEAGKPTEFEDETSFGLPDTDEQDITFDDLSEDDSFEEESFEESTVTIGSDIDEFDAAVDEISLEPDDDLIGPDESADNEEVDALASMDLEQELSDIDELTDEDEPAGGQDIPDIDGISNEDQLTTEDELADIEEFSEEDISDDDELVAPVSEEVPTEDFEVDEQSELQPDTDIEVTDESTRNVDEIPSGLREEIRSVLTYMDQLLESLPEDKIREFAESEHFEVYKRLFEELDLEP
ncbi:MAG: hypothetical protein EA383_11935 [Spirochaetaceae bacterium]|nr:MAG: hypothetical protein EA383_11935 [Spirochaetaceae bacterium]